MKEELQFLLVLSLAAAASADAGRVESNDVVHGSGRSAIVLSVSTEVNGVGLDDIPDILERLRKLRIAIKSLAFEALSRGVDEKRRTLQETRNLINAVKSVLEESLSGLRQVRLKVEKLYLMQSPLGADDALFLHRIKTTIPDIIAFTEEQFRAVVDLF